MIGGDSVGRSKMCVVRYGSNRCVIILTGNEHTEVYTKFYKTQYKLTCASKTKGILM